MNWGEFDRLCTNPLETPLDHEQGDSWVHRDTPRGKMDIFTLVRPKSGSYARTLRDERECVGTFTFLNLEMTDRVLAPPAR